MLSESVALAPPADADWWKGGEIGFRTEDIGGQSVVMVNVTAMLQGVGKRWSHYRELKGAEELIAHAEVCLGIPRQSLIQTGGGRTGDTWVIEQIALDAAAWALTPLRWWMLNTALAVIKGEKTDIVADTPSTMVLLNKFLEGVTRLESATESGFAHANARMDGFERELASIKQAMAGITEQRVYVVANITTGIVKFGRTEDIDTRIKSYAQNNLRLMGHVSGGKPLEDRVKKMLRDNGHRPAAGKEYYPLNPDVIKVLTTAGLNVGMLAQMTVFERSRAHGKKIHDSGAIPLL